MEHSIVETQPGQRARTRPPVPICRDHRCGLCVRCLDEARWERIFRQKFADPTYYRKRPVKYSSPLA